MTSPVLSLTPDQLQQALSLAEQVAKDPKRFSPWAKNPVGFCKEVLGVSLWSKQEEVLTATRDHRRIAVRSGHSVGKTFAVACLVLWWLYAVQGLVVTTAPTWDHVEGVMWREINTISQNSLLPLPGEPFQTE